MRLVWVQQWTVLPVIVEDREMMDDTIQRGRLPGAGQQVDPSMRSRLSDSEGPSSTRQFLPSFFVRPFSLDGRYTPNRIPLIFLTARQKMHLPRILPMISTDMELLFNNRFQVVHLSTFRATSLGGDNLLERSACLGWLGPYLIISLRCLDNCRTTISSASS